MRNVLHIDTTEGIGVKHLGKKTCLAVSKTILKPVRKAAKIYPPRPPDNFSQHWLKWKCYKNVYKNKNYLSSHYCSRIGDTTELRTVSMCSDIITLTLAWCTQFMNNQYSATINNTIERLGRIQTAQSPHWKGCLILGKKSHSKDPSYYRPEY